MVDQQSTGPRALGAPKVSRSKANKHGRPIDGPAVVHPTLVKRVNRARSDKAIVVPNVSKIAKSNRARQA